MERGIYVDGPITMLPGSRLAPTDSERHNAAAVEIKTILEGNEKKEMYRTDRCSTNPRRKICSKVFLGSYQMYPKTFTPAHRFDRKVAA